MKRLVLPVHYAYGGLALLISVINNVFLLFYVTVFVSVFQIDGTSFYIGETIFLLWNSINDPLFGWLSDSKNLQNTTETQDDIVLKRINALSRFGPLFSLSFLLFWFQLIPVSLQFSLALCLYDGFLTMVDLHHQSLLADLVIKAEDRVTLNSYCSVFSAAGSLSVFISFALWEKNNMMNFQILCVVLSILACIGFYICCESLRTFYIQNSKSDHQVKPDNSISHIANLKAIKKYGKQVLRHKNFLIFASMNLIQVFHCHFNSNFFPLFLQHLLGHRISPSGGALIMGLSFLVPHLNNLYFLQLCNRYGTYLIIKMLFGVKLLLAVIMWCLGTSYWYILCFYIISNRVFTEGTCKLLNLVISDLVDEDYVKFKRTTPVSALVFGTSALLSKPGQTLAPLLGSYLFYLQSGKSFFFESLSTSNNDSGLHAGHEDYKDACFNVLILVPIVCAMLQLFVWNFYSLKDKYLIQIKMDRYNDELSHYNVHIV